MESQLIGFAPRVSTRRIVEHWRHFHADDGSICTHHGKCGRKTHDVLLSRDVSENLVMTEGRNELLDGVFTAAPSGFTWYVGLVGDASPNVYAAGDTLASHAGWTEVTPYSGNRLTWTPNGAASGGAMSNSSSRASFAITGSASVGGAFLASVNTGTAGLLYGAGDFSATRSVQNGDTLNVQVDLSITSS